MRRCMLATLLCTMGCTADFFVGPEAGSSGAADPTSEGMPNDDGGPGGPTSSTPDPTTTGTPDPTTTDETTSAETAVATASESDTGSTTTGTSAETDASTTAVSGETEEPEDCVRKDAAQCELAFPTCLWDGETCTFNPCLMEDELACLETSPECFWVEGACIPSGCELEAECSPLEFEVCVKTKGCVSVIDMCFSTACVPCNEVDDPKLCAELPNCAYNEGRAACLPQ